VLFPILDPGGRPIALGGRILPGREGPSSSGRIEPKYKNTQETAIYQKRRTLYGLNWAKKDVVASNEVVVCEGYTDVIAFFRAGLPRAVATCGTALAEEHFRVLRNFATRVVLSYDADAAGQHAAESVYQWERSHEVAVAVARLPQGSDPAELGRTDPDALVASVRDAVPFLQFRLDASLANADLSSPEGRATAADRALAVILEHPSDLVRDQYVMQVAERCRLDPASIRADAARRLARGVPAVRARTTPPRASVREDRPGTEALRLVLHERKEILGRLSPTLFADELQRRAFEAVAAAADNAEAIDQARARGEDDVVDLLCRLLVEEPQRPPTGDPVTPVVAQLIRHATRRVLDDRQRAIREGSVHVRDVNEEISAAKELVERLEGPDGDEAERELLEWLRMEADGGADDGMADAAG
jgi:DNA primase